MVANSIVEEYYCEVRKHLHCPEDVQNALLTKVNTPMMELQVDCPNFDRSTIITVFGEPEELANHLERFFLEEEMIERETNKESENEKTEENNEEDKEPVSKKEVPDKITNTKKRNAWIFSKIAFSVIAISVGLTIFITSTVCLHFSPDVSEEKTVFIGEEAEVPTVKMAIDIIDHLRNLND